MGKSGNPRGGPGGYAGLAKMLRDECQDGLELKEYVFSILRDPTAKRSERWQALLYITERGFGKTPNQIELTANINAITAANVIDLDKLSTEQLKAMDRLLSEANKIIEVTHVKALPAPDIAQDE